MVIRKKKEDVSRILFVISFMERCAMNNIINSFIKYKSLLISIIVTILIILFIATCYEQWNEMWYNVGRNLYHLLH